MGIIKNEKMNLLKIILVSFIIVVFSNNIYSQVEIENKNNIVSIVDGKKYYLHEVLKSQTLYSISKAYDVAIIDILDDNPIALNGIKPKMILKIRYIYKNIQPENKVNYTVHVVQPGNTLYSIAKQYNVEIIDIIELNPGAGQNLPLGYELKIPKKEVVKTDDIVMKKPEIVTFKHLVGKKETFYSISKLYNLQINEIQAVNPNLVYPKVGEYINIPTTKENKSQKIADSIKVSDSTAALSETKTDSSNIVPANTFVEPSTYNIALLMPFDCERADSYIENGEIIEQDVTKIINPNSLASTEFLQGILIAIDSLKDIGLSAKIHIYDTKGDPEEVKRIILRQEFGEMNMVIGPPFLESFNLLLQYINKKEIKLVSYQTNENSLKFHSNVSSVFPLDKTKIEYTAKYIAEKYKNKNIIIVNGESNDYNTQVFKSQMLNYKNLRAISVKEFNYNNGAFNVLGGLTSNDTTIVVMFLENPAHINDMLSKLSLKSNPNRGIYPIVLFSYEGIADNENIDINSLERLNYHYFTSDYTDYSNDAVINFMEKYIKKYNCEPSKYAFHGYDIAFYYLTMLNKYGSNYTESLPFFRKKMLQMNFEYEKIGEFDGFENKSVFIMKYKDFSILKAN